MASDSWERDANVARAEIAAIVTGSSSGTGREVACGVASRGWAVVVVYLEHQRSAEATVDDILAAEGRTVAVRADLADDLDVQRLFAESVAAFGGVDVVVHTTAVGCSLLYGHAARQVRENGAIVTVPPAERMTLEVARRLRERGVTVATIPSEAVLSFLDTWRPGIG